MSELDDMIKAAHALADKELDKYKDKRREHFTTTMLVLLTGAVIWCLVT
jgi:DNA-binding protein YbaB